MGFGFYYELLQTWEGVILYIALSIAAIAFIYGIGAGTANNERCGSPL